MSTADVTDATFETEVLDSDVPVVVDFWAPWCRPCKAIEPVLEALVGASEGRLRLVRLDIDANLATPSRYGVLSIPTVIVFSGGEARETIVGARGRGVYDRVLAPYVGR